MVSKNNAVSSIVI